MSLNRLMDCAENPRAVMKTKILPLIVLVTVLGTLPVALRAVEGVEPPVPVRTVAPKFPDEMRRSGSGGIVTVSILIDEKGNVTEPKIVKASNDAFSEPALEALKKWKFKAS